MKKPLLLSIDIGTLSIRAALVDSSGEVIAISGISEEIHSPHVGWSEQDPDLWWDYTIKNIRNVLKEIQVEHSEIVAIGVGGQMHAPVSIGQNGELLSSRVQLWNDKRSNEIVEKFRKGQSLKEAIQITQNQPLTSWAAFKIMWVKMHNAEIYNKTWKFLTPKDFINYKLTGKAMTDYSEASGSYLMDAQRNNWSDDMADMLELDLSKMPEICNSSHVIGKVTKEVSMLTGLKEGIPVVAGGGDLLCAVFASGKSERGDVVEVSGTGSAICLISDKPFAGRGLMNLRHVVIDKWVPFGCVDASGPSIELFKELFFPSEVDGSGNSKGYKHIDEIAESAEPGSHGLLYFPYLIGERNLGIPESKGVFFGISIIHDRGLFIRSVMEGIAFDNKRALEIMEKFIPGIKSVILTGGGANSRIWNQIRSDIYQKPICTIHTKESGIVGAALLAALGVGLFKNEDSALKKLFKIKDKYYPDTKFKDRYNYMFDIFKEAHDLFEVPFKKLTHLS